MLTLGEPALLTRRYACVNVRQAPVLLEQFYKTLIIFIGIFFSVENCKHIVVACLNDNTQNKAF